MDVQGAFPLPAVMDKNNAWCTPCHHQHCVCGRVYPIPLLAVWMCRVFVSLFLNARMPDCPVSDQSDIGTNKYSVTGTSPVSENKGTQSGTGMLRYRTVRPDAGMPMPSNGFELIQAR